MPAGERFITADGFRALRAEYDQLFSVERPKVVEIISWAAANGDRSENGDYIYGRKRLREIDRRIGFLARAMRQSKVVDPSDAPRDEVRFGAVVDMVDDADRRRTIRIVGDDEADATDGRVGWSAPIARALIGARVGDERCIRLPAGETWVEVIAIAYPDRA